MIIPSQLPASLPPLDHDGTLRDTPALRQNPWLAVYQDRLQRARAAQDAGLRQHFDAELAVMRPMLEAPQAPSIPQRDASMAGPAGGTHDLLIDAVAQQHGVDANLLKCLIAKESQGDTQAVSTAGALGLMQVKPSTAGEVLGLSSADEGQVAQRLLSDPAFNIDVGTRYFAQLLQQTGSLEGALGAYNQGPNADWTQSAEAQDYVQAITQSLHSGSLPQWGAATPSPPADQPRDASGRMSVNTAPPCG